MAATYTPIASTTLGTATSSVTFSSIPQTYTDLVLVVDYSMTSSTNLQGEWNGDTGANYAWTYLEGVGSSASTGKGTNSAIANLGYSTANQRSNAIIHFQNYSNTTTNKTVLNRQNDAGATSYVSLTTNLWRNTAAITSMRIYVPAGNFASSSTFNLYGILAGS